jgi:catechol 2,3-dioxygenase-like lactoylglutathione lyase family enzyme
MNLNQVTLPTLDLQRAVQFYETLGLRLIVLSMPRYARFECPVGQGTFSLHLVDELPKGQGPIVYFECDDLDTKVAAWIENGIVFETQPTDQPWLWREASLRDPDGNALILFFAGNNRKNPPWRIDPTIGR